ncbi:MULTISPECIES: zonular occludens toxin domain-containing protein [unclassified Acinetobacter]|uniref:zonular occludens toxin domain-containing protein n=1 Tax=unclassified Acinetobacter TaxID=196816 RepID=UPI00124F9E5C|nr:MULTISPECIES: zonular occludens toxin domain-containing protein [unclassified Acinetobacter]
MSLLISAPIRTGKTLKAMELCYEYLNKGRQVYTNIIGIKIPGVLSVSSGIGDPFDWRDLPNGSVLIWDEAHEHPAFSEKDLLKNFKIDETRFDEWLEHLNSDPNLSTTKIRENIAKVEKAKKEALETRKQQIRDIGEALLMHGHFGVEIIFITQRPAKLNADVLASVTSHFVMRRKFGMDAAIIWEFGEAMTTWSRSTASYALNKTLWRYPKHLYKFYTSSESHQVRKSFPLKYVAIGLIPLLLFYKGFDNARETGFFGLFGKKKEVSQQVQSVQSVPPVQQQTIEQAAVQHDSKDKIICTYQNIHLPECQALQQRAQADLNHQIQGTYYNANDPYLTVTPTIVKLDASDFPRLSGCIKYGGHYYGIDQQGNKMPNVKEEACRRWIEESKRPFDYFANGKNSNYNETKPKQENSLLGSPTDTVKNVTQQAVNPS